MEENRSVELSGYRFDANQEGLDRIESSENLVFTSVQLAPSYGAQSLDLTHESNYYPAQPTIPTSPVSKPAPYSRSAKADRQRRSNGLSWRVDPDESLSDWTLTVVSNPQLNKSNNDFDSDHDDEESDEDEGRDDERHYFQLRRKQNDYPIKKYFVHRTQLAVGPRRSDYFAKMFHYRNTKKKNGKSPTGTRIELRPSAAAAFPAMLDFMYSSDPPNTTTESAVALRHLATCFGIRPLFEAVTEFIKTDLRPDTAPTYLVEAHGFSHEKLFQSALNICAQHFESIKFSHLVKLTPQLFEQVVSSPLMECSSEALSSRVASYCRCRPGVVDAETLQLLTHPDRMPKIAAEESLFFLHLIAEVEQDDADDESLSIGGRRKLGTNSLYSRCVEASDDIVRIAILNTRDKKDSAKKVKKGKKSSSESRPTRTAVKEYYSLPAQMRVDLLENALLNSPTKEDLEVLERARKEAKKKFSDEALGQVRELESEMEHMRKRYEKKIATYQAQLDAQEQEIRAYATELSKFVRIPNEYRIPPTVSDYTYQEMPEFDDYGESVYGDIPPSSMPRFGNQPEEGFLYQETRFLKNGSRAAYKWPMFYYKGD
jgi:hypothetical protein